MSARKRLHSLRRCKLQIVPAGAEVASGLSLNRNAASYWVTETYKTHLRPACWRGRYQVRNGYLSFAGPPTAFDKVRVLVSLEEHLWSIVVSVYQHIYAAFHATQEEWSISTTSLLTSCMSDNSPWNLLRGTGCALTCLVITPHLKRFRALTLHTF